MALPALKQTHLSYADYLALEQGSQEKHTYWDGEIFAMAGASQEHYLLESRLVVRLGMQMVGKPCQPYTGNVRLRQIDSDKAVYADAVVVCGRLSMHPDDPQAATNPTVVMEVLSDSTEVFDRGAKFAYYRTFPSLQSFVLLSQAAPRVEHYRREADGRWVIEDLGVDDTLHLPSVDAHLAVREIYEGLITE